MSYQSERDQFIVRMTREGLPLHAIESLLRQATTIHRLAELECSSEAADRDRIKCPATRNHGKPGPCLCDSASNEDHGTIPRIRLQDYHAGQRAIKAVAGLPGWHILTEGDPRGYTLRVIPPSYAERNEGRDRHNLDSIGVPARESRIRW